ncbi:hypothetical protein GLOIN_2v1093440 [Rhizophagus irregularis DAOM 181602=DAOM 197198]|nr:hypothetical protein GLOIN_2v1093440 [Rhizophagus irregularis DAOM 181602=DAOM 197198]
MKQGLSTVFKDTTIYAYLVDGFGAKRDVCNERIIISHGGGKSYKQNEVPARYCVLGGNLKASKPFIRWKFRFESIDTQEWWEYPADKVDLDNPNSDDIHANLFERYETLLKGVGKSPQGFFFFYFLGIWIRTHQKQCHLVYRHGYLVDMLSKGFAYNTIVGYRTAVSETHEHVDGHSIETHPCRKNDAIYSHHNPPPILL